MLSRCPYGAVGDTFKVEGGWHRIVAIRLVKMMAWNGESHDPEWNWCIDCELDLQVGTTAEGAAIIGRGLTAQALNRGKGKR